jgi:hypothetical protein
MEAFYEISAENVVQNNGSYLLQRRFGGSVVAALRFAWPEHEWLDWRFSRASKDFWKTPAHRRKYFDWLGKTQLGISDASDAEQLEKWYTVTGRLFRLHHGSGLLRMYYDDNYIKALEENYPGHNWVTWKFRKVPDSHWASVPNQRAFFNYLGSKYLGILSKTIGENGEDGNHQGLDAWYSAKWSVLRREEGSLRSILVKYYNSSPSSALAAIYPGHSWDIHQFIKEPQGGAATIFVTSPVVGDSSAPVQATKLDEEKTKMFKRSMAQQGFWVNPEHQRDFVVQAQRKLGYERLEDWYRVSQDDLINIGGGSLLLHYGGSPYSLLLSVFPDHKWIPWKFYKLPRTFWDDIANQKSFFEWAAAELGFRDLAGWYDVSTRQVHHLGGGSLLNNKYGGSLANALMVAHPKHDWLPWEFKTTQARWWGAPENQRTFLDWAQKKLQLASLEDWYVGGTHDAIASIGGYRLLSLHGSLHSALQQAYPDHKWEPWRWKHTQKGDVK